MIEPRPHHDGVAAHVLLAPVYRTRRRLGECLIRQQRSLETRRHFLRAFGRIHDGPAFHYDQRVSRRRCLNHHHAIGAHEICPPEAFHFDELCQLRARFPYAAVRHGRACARDERYQEIISITDIHVRVFFPTSAARVRNDRTESRSYPARDPTRRWHRRR